MGQDDRKPIPLRVALEGAGDGPTAGFSVRVEDAESGRELAGVYKVEFEAAVDGVAHVIVHAYPVAVDVTGEGFAKPSREVGIMLKGEGHPEYVRLPVVEDVTELGGTGSRTYTKVVGA